MIKTALKHWIYELCIDQLFNGFLKNFIIPHKHDIKMGDKFYYIYYPSEHTGCEVYYFDCEVMEIGTNYFSIKGPKFKTVTSTIKGREILFTAASGLNYWRVIIYYDRIIYLSKKS